MIHWMDLSFLMTFMSSQSWVLLPRFLWETACDVITYRLYTPCSL